MVEENTSQPVYLLVPLRDGIVDSRVVTAQFANGLENGRPERSVEVPPDAVVQLVYSGLVSVTSHGALRKQHHQLAFDLGGLRRGAYVGCPVGGVEHFQGFGDPALRCRHCCGSQVSATVKGRTSSLTNPHRMASR
jgi:hypothetical protein